MSESDQRPSGSNAYSLATMPVRVNNRAGILSMSDTNQSFWYKEIFSNQFFVNGAPVPFEQLSGNRGVIVLDNLKDAILVTALTLAAAEHRAGIVRISAEQYELEKKRRILPKSRWPLDAPLRIFNPQRKPKPAGVESVEAAAPESNGLPALPPTPVVEASARPTTKRLSEVLKDATAEELKTKP